MAWVVPRVWTVLEQATAAKLNEISSALNDLDRRTSPVNSYVMGPGTTVLTSYGDMNIGVGPAVTVTIGSVGKALVAMSASMNGTVDAAAVFMTYVVSGSSSYGPIDDTALAWTALAGYGIRMGIAILHSALNVGSTTFATKERVTAGIGTYDSLRISVTPLGS